MRETKAFDIIYNGKYIAVLHNLIAFELGVSIGLERPYINLGIGTIMIVLRKE